MSELHLLEVKVSVMLKDESCNSLKEKVGGLSDKAKDLFRTEFGDHIITAMLHAEASHPPAEITRIVELLEECDEPDDETPPENQTGRRSRQFDD